MQRAEAGCSAEFMGRMSEGPEGEEPQAIHCGSPMSFGGLVVCDRSMECWLCHPLLVILSMLQLHTA